MGQDEKWLSRARQAPRCHFCATFICLPSPKRDNGSGHGHAPHLQARPQGQCIPQKRDQWEQCVCSPLEGLHEGGDP